MINPALRNHLSQAILSNAMDGLDLTRQAKMPVVGLQGAGLLLVGRAGTGPYLTGHEVKGDEKDTRSALLRGKSLASVFQRMGIL